VPTQLNIWAFNIRDTLSILCTVKSAVLFNDGLLSSDVKTSSRRHHDVVMTSPDVSAGRRFVKSLAVTTFFSVSHKLIINSTKKSSYRHDSAISLYFVYRLFQIWVN